jgi:hypothetical protein
MRPQHHQGSTLTLFSAHFCQRHISLMSISWHKPLRGMCYLGVIVSIRVFQTHVALKTLTEFASTVKKYEKGKHLKASVVSMVRDLIGMCYKSCMSLYDN